MHGPEMLNDGRTATAESLRQRVGVPKARVMGGGRESVGS